MPKKLLHILRTLLFFFLTSQASAEYVAGITWIPDVAYGIGGSPEAACIDYVSNFVTTIPDANVSFGGVYQTIDASFDLCGELFDWLPASSPACLLPSNGCNGVANIWQKEVKRIEISPFEGDPISSSVIANVRPRNTKGEYPDTILLIARVYDEDNILVPNMDVRIDVDVLANSGGHNHDDMVRHITYPGRINYSYPFNSVAGNTGATGFIFRFTPPEIAGEHIFEAECVEDDCEYEGPKNVHVGLDNLVVLPPSYDGSYVLIGETPSHKSNHWVTGVVLTKITFLAKLYKELFSENPSLHLNDASLQHGGLFDISSEHRWSPPHKSHRDGENIDVRANPEYNPGSAVPEKDFKRFRRLVSIVGGSAAIHSGDTPNQHFHLGFY